MDKDSQEATNSNSDSPILQKLEVNGFKFRNRIVMAALTRQRADPITCVPNELHCQYYAERAEEAAFVISEAIAVCAEGNTIVGGANLFNDDQEEGWKKVTDAVHAVNGYIFAQLSHCGRIKPPELASEKNCIWTSTPLAPSKVRCREKKGTLENVEPEEMSTEKIKEVVQSFTDSAKRAKNAGFDGIEFLAANGYLVDQFLRSETNKRTDEYGGNYIGRCKFPLEVLDAIIDVWGADKVGVKVSPVGIYNDMYDLDPEETYSYFLNQLQKRGILFVEIMEGFKVYFL